MDVREMLVEQGCLLEGDFLFSLKSGQVAQKYLNFDRVLPHYGPLCFLADKIVEQVTRVTQMIDVIGAPAVGAIPLAYRVQERMDLGPGRRPTVVFAEKDGESFSLQRWKFAE